MKRDLRNISAKVLFCIGLAFSAFQLITAGFGTLPELQQRAIHIIFGCCLAFLSYSIGRRAQPDTHVALWDMFLVGAVMVANVNVFLNYEHILRYPGESTIIDLVLGVILILLVLETARRVSGAVIPVMVGMGLVYLFLGPYLPGRWGFNFIPFGYIITSIYYSPNGIYGIITGVSATVLAAFIIFGRLLLNTGAGQTFIDLAVLLAGRFRGGPAKVAIVASALFGTITGSAVANVMVTGTYTIPLMKRLGYKPEFAGAVEASASTGGMITPPIMGVGAFIMSELLGISYLKICVYAIIPCIIYYTCVFSGVHFEALRLGLIPVPKEERPSWRKVLDWSRLCPFLIPIVILFVLLGRGFEITTAAFYACIANVLVFLFSARPTISNLRNKFSRVLKALSDGGLALTEIVPLLVGVNILLSVFSLSGVMVKVSEMVLGLGGTSIIGALLTAALVPLVLGVAIAPVAVYILSVSIIAPALTGLGFKLLPIHMFLFYLSVLAPITPPMCIACFAASSIARAPWIKIAWIAMRLSAVAFIIPFFFIIDPALLAYETSLDGILGAACSAIVGAILMAAGFFGYLVGKLGPLQRILFSVSGFLLLMPGWRTDLVGIALAGLALLFQILIQRGGRSEMIG